MPEKLDWKSGYVRESSEWGWFCAIWHSRGCRKRSSCSRQTYDRYLTVKVTEWENWQDYCNWSHQSHQHANLTNKRTGKIHKDLGLCCYYNPCRCTQMLSIPPRPISHQLDYTSQMNSTHQISQSKLSKRLPIYFLRVAKFHSIGLDDSELSCHEIMKRV